MRLTTDIFEYCREQRAAVEHDLDLRLPHPREGLLGRAGGGVHALQRDRLRGGRPRPGLEIDEFAPRLAFFFNCHNNVFQEIAKFRAVRRMWARIMRERFGASDERSQMIRFHTQTGGVTLQAQQPEVNIIRVALQGFAAVCGGTQSLHTNGFDEALALPTERSARIALRTQQVLAHESGAADTVDPFAGSYFVESLTDEIEKRAWELIDKVERARRLGRGARVHPARDRGVGGLLPRALPQRPGHHRRRQQVRHRPGRRRRHPQGRPRAERRQLERLAAFKAARDQAEPSTPRLRGAARGRPRARATCCTRSRTRCATGASIGEVCGAMRDVFGEYRGGAFF